MLGVRRNFIARHFLTGGDWGRENLPNSHRYLLELRLIGNNLDSHGYLCDILEVERELDAVLGRFAETMLNDLPEFAGLNPSLENFAGILARALHPMLEMENIGGMRVVLWEDDHAWASCELSR